MTLGQFVELFDGWVRDYNTARPHSALGGQTPLQRWCCDATPLRVVADSELRWLLLADEERTIVKDGIHFHGLAYVQEAIDGDAESAGLRSAPYGVEKLMDQAAIAPEDDEEASLDADENWKVHVTGRPGDGGIDENAASSEVARVTERTLRRYRFRDCNRPEQTPAGQLLRAVHCKSQTRLDRCPD